MSWFIQHLGKKVEVLGEEQVSHLQHRTLMLERHKRPDLTVLFNERLQYRLAKRISDDAYLIIRSKKDAQSTSRLTIRKPRRVPSDEGPA